MARHYNLNKLRLEVDEHGFVLGGIPEKGKTVIIGDFDTPEIIILRFFRHDVILSYLSQPEVIASELKGNPDPLLEDGEVIETIIQLKPGANWFELDHTKFNEVYLES